ncbi:MAG: type III PLP-dependent enzyme, partial [Nitrospirae bacterium]|nr:type III PLP-dependent enzyme [Nitrospirota bacterium]
VELYYAMKSNPDPNILQLIRHLVDGIDVASYGEVCIADQAGYSSDRFLHSHPVKKEQDIEDCIKHGIRWFVFDNFDEIPKLQRFASKINLLLRVAIKNDSCVVDLSSKYGADQDSVLPLLFKARNAGLNVRGISFHVGSQSADPAIYKSALLKIKNIFNEAAKFGFSFDTLDIGGGFPISYRTSFPDRYEFCRVVSGALKKYFPGNIRIIAEPGRIISGDALTHVVSVTGKSYRNNVPWYYIDDGLYGAFSGKLFDHCDYRLVSEKPGPYEECVVAGPTCDSIDIVSRDQKLPELEVGDLLLAPGMGAYTVASATNFNGFSVPETLVFYNEEGDSILDDFAATESLSVA